MDETTFSKTSWRTLEVGEAPWPSTATPWPQPQPNTCPPLWAGITSRKTFLYKLSADLFRVARELEREEGPKQSWVKLGDGKFKPSAAPPTATAYHPPTTVHNLYEAEVSLQHALPPPPLPSCQN